MISWCAEHQCGNLPNNDTKGWASVPGQAGKCLFAEEFGGRESCRIVEALLIVKENGQWPEALIEQIMDRASFRSHDIIVAILDALAGEQ